MNNVELLSSLSTEELQNLIQVAQNFQIDGQTSYPLPATIKEDLDNTTTKDRKSATARFIKRLNRYDGENWTRGGATNKQLVSELKRSQVDANQLVQQIYKDGEKIRNTARAATELYEDIEAIMEEDEKETIQQHLSTIQQKCQVLAVYGYSSAKQLDEEARRITSINIKLPNSMRDLIETEEDDKEMAFSQEDMELLRTERFHERLLQQSSYRRGNGNGNGNNYGRHSTRGGRQQHFNNRGNSRGNFFGKPRQHQSNYQSNNQFNNSPQQSQQQQTQPSAN
jgi:hypothetical protein